jgi:hypothetical protein
MHDQVVLWDSEKQPAAVTQALTGEGLVFHPFMGLERGDSTAALLHTCDQAGRPFERVWAQR